MNRRPFILSKVNIASLFFHFKEKLKYIFLCVVQGLYYDGVKANKWCNLTVVVHCKIQDLLVEYHLKYGRNLFSPKDMEGFQLLCAKMGRIAAVEISFCERTIYNLVIVLFMCLHRLSLDATGHVWEANVFMALFLISQAIFFPLHSASMAFKPIRHGRLSQKIYQPNIPVVRFINVWSAHICSTALLALLDDKRSVSTFSMPDLYTHRAALALQSFIQMYRIHAKPQRINMDYFPATGKLFCVMMVFTYVSVSACEVWQLPVSLVM